MIYRILIILTIFFVTINAVYRVKDRLTYNAPEIIQHDARAVNHFDDGSFSLKKVEKQNENKVIYCIYNRIGEMTFEFEQLTDSTADEPLFKFREDGSIKEVSGLLIPKGDHESHETHIFFDHENNLAQLKIKKDSIHIFQEYFWDENMKEWIAI